MVSSLFGRPSQKTCVMIAGIAMILGGVWICAGSSRFLAESDRAPGTVVSVVGDRGAKGTSLYHAIARYTPRSTMTPITFRDRTGFWPSPFRIGDAVTVAYRPATPAAARIVSFWTIWLLPALMTAFGFGVALGGYVMRV